jgi:hypothetical protein
LDLTNVGQTAYISGRLEDETGFMRGGAA